MLAIWAKILLPWALKSGPKCKKSPNLVTLIMIMISRLRFVAESLILVATYYRIIGISYSRNSSSNHLIPSHRKWEERNSFLMKDYLSCNRLARRRRRPWRYCSTTALVPLSTSSSSSSSSCEIVCKLSVLECRRVVQSFLGTCSDY